MRHSIATLGLLAAALLAGCGGSAAFQLTSDDNDPDQLKAALDRRELGGGRGAIAADQHARVFAVISGEPRRLLAFDLTEGRTTWTVDADVQSRVVVGADFVAAVEGTQLVARELGTGAVRWQQPLGGTLAGLTADEERIYVVTRGGDGGRYWLTARSGATGETLWSADADGQLGAPAAQGGLVFSPFVKQWLSVLDGRTGKQLARIRGVDDEISFVRSTSDATWFGSARGVFRLDLRAASGRRNDATYGAVTLPPQLDTARYAADAYDAVQTGYSAADRARILWRANPRSEGALAWDGGGYAVHYFRVIIGYGLDGAIRWAYSHPRVELVATEHLGSVIAGMSASGDVVAIEPTRGLVRHRVNIGLGAGQVLGATFDGDGWEPPGVGDAEADTVAALASIARDRDRRFEKVKELAIKALAGLPGATVTGDLLALLADDRTTAKLKDLVADVLVTRQDVGGLPALVEALAERDDVITGTTASDVGVLARAVGGLGRGLSTADQLRATLALTVHLQAPATDLGDLLYVIAALGDVGGPAATDALIAHLMMYRVDADLGDRPEWAAAIAGAVVRAGGARGREALRFVGSDPRTQPPLATLAASIATAATQRPE